MGIISAAIYDAIKHGRKMVVPGFRGFIVDCINDTSFDKYGINEKTLFDFFELAEIKKELDLLKQTIVLEENLNFKPSYNDVLSFLIKHYKKQYVEYPVEQKLKVVIPLKQIRPLSLSSKLDGKTRISFSLGS